MKNNSKSVVIGIVLMIKNVIQLNYIIFFNDFDNNTVILLVVIKESNLQLYF